MKLRKRTVLGLPVLPTLAVITAGAAAAATLYGLNMRGSAATAANYSVAWAGTAQVTAEGVGQSSTSCPTVTRDSAGLQFAAGQVPILNGVDRCLVRVNISTDAAAGAVVTGLTGTVPAGWRVSLADEAVFPAYSLLGCGGTILSGGTSSRPVGLLIEPVSAAAGSVLNVDNIQLTVEPYRGSASFVAGACTAPSIGAAS